MFLVFFIIDVPGLDEGTVTYGDELTNALAPRAALPGQHDSRVWKGKKQSRPDWFVHQLSRALARTSRAGCRWPGLPHAAAVCLVPVSVEPV